MKACSLFSTLILFLVVRSADAATVIHVPADQPTIQAAINVANNGDTVLVSPGTYTENINFLGKAITVTSSNGPEVTTIDGGSKDSVVAFVNKETTTSTIRGFTIKNGIATSFGGSGGGIVMQFSSAATVSGNIITGNQGCTGGGVYNQAGSPIIIENIITNNTATCGNGSGGGIELDATVSPQIVGNSIRNNTAPSGGGGGITIEGVFGQALISGNIIQGNVAWGQGGGIYAFNDDDALVIQNLIVDNRAGEGAGADWQVVLNTQGPVMINNTFSGNVLSSSCSYCQMQGSAVFMNGFYGNSMFYNNLFVANLSVATPQDSAFYCANDFSSTPPTLMNNDAYSVGGVGFGLVCSGAAGTNGNVSLNPQFVGSANYRLKGGSPAIDAGDNSAPNLPSTDFAGNPRIINGNDGPIAIVDMGAYEFVPVTLTPKSLNFGTQTVGSTTTKTVTLTNAQDRSLSVSSKTVPTGYNVSGCGSSVAAFSSCSLMVTFHPMKTGVYKGKLIVKDNAGNSPQIVTVSGTAQ